MAVSHCCNLRQRAIQHGEATEGCHARRMDNQMCMERKFEEIAVPAHAPIQ